jgi:hypothetical protein
MQAKDGAGAEQTEQNDHADYDELAASAREYQHDFEWKENGRSTLGRRDYHKPNGDERCCLWYYLNEYAPVIDGYAIDFNHVGCEFEH